MRHYQNRTNRQHFGRQHFGRKHLIVLLSILVIAACAILSACNSDTNPTSTEGDVMLMTVDPNATPIPTDHLQDDGSHLVINNAVFPITVSGIDSSSGQGTPTLHFTDTASLSLTETLPEFNRLTLDYTADAPLKCTISFKDGSADDVIYLEEAATRTSCRFLTDNYLDGGRKADISAISFTILSGDECTLTLFPVKLEAIAVPTDDTVYIENESYKVGAYMIWGGGLSYIEYKNDNNDAITNLLNRCDTGRLVQQSYYGTKDSPYVCGKYGTTTWPYNPVQGGDLHNNKSRLIDFEIGENYVYVKCQPLDWAHNNSRTPSYMSNKYTLVDGYILVDNYFTDFSGYEHGNARDQELPAFYVVSGLSDFVYYNGSEPWTDGELTYERDLPFWADGDSVCRTTIARDNTEVWCAWVDSDDFGIGLFVPGVTKLLKGRHGFNGSFDPADGATNYVAPLRVMTIESFVPIEYSYMISAGSVSEMRSLFKANKDVIDNSALVAYGD